MRRIDYIVVHCTATQPNASPEAILRYWRQVLGWKSPGYHYLIKKGGEIVPLLPESEVSNGVKGYNSHSVHLSYIGGIDGKGFPKDTRTAGQKESILCLLHSLKTRYKNAKIQGHRDFPGVTKACPSFDVRAWLKEVAPDLL
ncbi:N-acetylmuramoyl-L-alanine amidase [Larkinella knui]|uniref:N-acetylmuramoyl-L-alanine amidase n=1 Tax=Larkinella knui TaxID=2025310 RepID=A0A3P1CJB1_9BACT|nr:N-acetylmuramoyl-L-alanine amidase [Larkinella knui]RRB13432.1 N-acetylmuramoyl-L-alanine amidase [Larkinella knui]